MLTPGTRTCRCLALIRPSVRAATHREVRSRERHRSRLPEAALRRGPDRHQDVSPRETEASIGNVYSGNLEVAPG